MDVSNGSPQIGSDHAACYTFVAIERHSKLVLNRAMGNRDHATTDGVFTKGVRRGAVALPNHDGWLRAVPLRYHHDAARPL
ncbi:MAG: hypothetical protein LAO79_02495 [Acidobacteriia bacterium]|nr:hypothetical protein [Terriglobia bacterium]